MVSLFFFLTKEHKKHKDLSLDRYGRTIRASVVQSNFEWFAFFLTKEHKIHKAFPFDQ